MAEIPVQLAGCLWLFLALGFLLLLWRRDHVRFRLSRIERNGSEKAWRKWLRFERGFVLPLLIFVDATLGAAAAILVVLELINRYRQ